MTIFLLLFFLGVIGFMILIAVPFLTIGYFSYIFFMETSSHEIGFYSWLHDLIEKFVLSWFSFNKNIEIKFQDKEELDRSSQVFYGLHPHGLIAQGRILHTIHTHSQLRPYFIKSYQGVHSTLFRIPILREILLTGRCIPAHETFLDQFLQSGHSIAIYPGGSRETKFCSDDTDHNTDYFYIKKRKGFIRLAIKHNVPLVPIIFWEEQGRFQYTDIYILKKLSKFLRTITGHTVNLSVLQIFTPSNLKMLWNTLFGQEEQYVYVGKPLVAGKDDSIEVVHAQYIEALQGLYTYAKEDQKSKKELVIM